MPGFDATMLLFNLLVVVVGDLGKLAFPFQFENSADIFMQLRLILFESQKRVGTTLGDELRNRFLTTDGVDWHNTTR